MLMQKPFMDCLLPAPVGGGFIRTGYWVWCGSVIEDDEGRFHMFASMWEKSVAFSPNWLTNSRIVRAESDLPEGPYKYCEDVLPPRGPGFWDGRMTHNPTIHRYGNKYLLFYTGTTFDEETPTADRSVSPELRRKARANQRIGMAVSDSPCGPWRRPDRCSLDVRPGCWDALLTTNPAPCVLTDGRILLLYKSATAENSRIQYGVSMADSLDDPFQRIGPDGPLTFKDSSIRYEDAFVWHQNRAFHMIFNDMTGRLTGEDHAGAHAVSEDGIAWKLNDPPKAYSRKVRWNDGSETVQGSFERPQLLIRDGIPTHLFAATADGPGGFHNAENTWNMVVPLQTE